MSSTPTQPWEFELQFSRGDAVQGPYDRLTLREMLYTGRLTGDENVRAPGATTFTRLADMPEFSEVLDLAGRPRQSGRRSGGWKASSATVSHTMPPPGTGSGAASPSDAPDSGAIASTPASPAARAEPGPASAGGGPPMGLIIGGVILVLAVGGAVAFMVLGG